MNVLFHIDESLKWAMVLGNIQNMIQYFDQEAMHYRIELVANGPAFCELQDAVSEKMGFKNALLSLSSNIRICACRNALRANHISPELLLPFVEIVPAGVVEIALRQTEGFSYIKP